MLDVFRISIDKIANCFKLPRALPTILAMTQNTEQGSDNLKLAIGAILVGVFALALGDALIKKSDAAFVIWQIFILRSIIAAPLLVLCLRRRKADYSSGKASGLMSVLLPKQLVWTLIRSALLVVMWLIYYIALPKVDLSIAAASFYTLPIFITLFAALFLDERVGVFGWIAVVLGFCGVLLILQPQAEDFNLYVLLPIISAVLYALGMILTRSKCRDERPMVLSLWMNVTFILAGIIASLMIFVLQPTEEVRHSNLFLFGDWSPMDLSAWGNMIILSVALLAGSLGAAIAYQSGPASTIAIFDFGYVAFAIIWGVLLFDEVLDFTTIIGILMIVTGGILSTRRN
ncbi:MAG: drug/metabolite transporter (DMT)-like permease [Polaribacter sp.]|jgi:drug/metabolite transporter (DMT)-like permease